MVIIFFRQARLAAINFTDPGNLQNCYICKVKIIALIFSIYLLILPCVACAETDTCNDDLQSSVTQTGNHPEPGKEKEDCGSFCTCSCCVHIVSVNFQLYKISAEKLLDRNRLRLFYDDISLPSNYFGNIWQPPKFS